MLPLCKHVVVTYKTLIVKMWKDQIDSEVVISNVQKLLDVRLIILGLHDILSLLELVYTLIKYAHLKEMCIIVILLKLSRCAYRSYTNCTIILNASSRMGLSSHFTTSLC
jgi:hypothetical protein